MAVRGDACHKPTFGAVWGELCPCCYRCQGVFRLTGHPSAQTSRAGCLQGLSEPPYVAQRDVPGLQLALAAAIAVYLLREKKRVSLGAPLHCVPAATQPAPLWQWLHAAVQECLSAATTPWPLLPAARAAGLSFAGLIFGALVGGAFQGWLRVDIVPIGVS